MAGNGGAPLLAPGLSGAGGEKPGAFAGRGRADETTERESPALDLVDITVTFAARGRDRAGYTAVRDTSLRVGRGEFVSVVGPTGCGKSTLLNIAAGLLKPSAGRVLVFGRELVDLNPRAGYMFQADALMPWLSARDNVAIGLVYRGTAKQAARSRAEEWLRRVGLGGHGERYPHELSGGMKKRVALAQMLILDPQILLMDEPFSALDIQTRQLMENELLDLWSADRKSVVFITHDLEEAIALSDRVVVLAAGPGTRPIGDFSVDLPRPRDVAEIRLEPRFVELHRDIWAAMKDEVLKGYAQSQAVSH
jgi:NitT/TauT family transport system ATP-binding protein